ncbi:hypothetical protein ACQY0O_006236 [Thecaphora frezii]
MSLGRFCPPSEHDFTVASSDQASSFYDERSQPEDRQPDLSLEYPLFIERDPGPFDRSDPSPATWVDVDGHRLFPLSTDDTSEDIGFAASSSHTSFMPGERRAIGAVAGRGYPLSIICEAMVVLFSLKGERSSCQRQPFTPPHEPVYEPAFQRFEPKRCSRRTTTSAEPPTEGLRADADSYGRNTRGRGHHDPLSRGEDVESCWANAATPPSQPANEQPFANLHPSLAKRRADAALQALRASEKTTRAQKHEERRHGAAIPPHQTDGEDPIQQWSTLFSKRIGKTRETSQSQSSHRSSVGHRREELEKLPGLSAKPLIPATRRLGRAAAGRNLRLPLFRPPGSTSDQRKAAEETLRRTGNPQNGETCQTAAPKLRATETIVLSDDAEASGEGTRKRRRLTLFEPTPLQPRPEQRGASSIASRRLGPRTSSPRSEQTVVDGAFAAEREGSAYRSSSAGHEMGR